MLHCIRHNFLTSHTSCGPKVILFFVDILLLVCIMDNLEVLNDIATLQSWNNYLLLFSLFLTYYNLSKGNMQYKFEKELESLKEYRSTHYMRHFTSSKNWAIFITTRYCRLLLLQKSNCGPNGAPYNKSIQ